MAIVVSCSLHDLAAQLPGPAGGIHSKDPKEDAGKLQPEHARQTHEGTPDSVAEALSAPCHTLSRSFRLSGGTRNLFGDSRPRTRRSLLVVGRPRLAVTHGLLAISSGGIRRSRRIHRSDQRLSGSPRSYSQCPAKAYRIHTVECSCSPRLRKDLQLPSNATPIRCIQARNKRR